MNPSTLDYSAQTQKFDVALLSNDDGAAIVGRAKYYRGAVYLGMV
jgi:hypothetical protein